MNQDMNVTQYKSVQNRAECVLAIFQKKYCFPTSPPIPSDMIARFLFNFQVNLGKLHRFGERTVGKMYTDGQILLDERNCRCQYNFTIAHEIGHWILHEHLLSGEFLDTPEMRNIFEWPLRSECTHQKKKQVKFREVEANWFAAALLVPYSFLLPAAQNYLIINADSVEELARSFDVAIVTMIYRLRDLSRHLLWEGPYIDEASLSTLETFEIGHFRSSKLISIYNHRAESQKKLSSRKIEAFQALDSWIMLFLGDREGLHPANRNDLSNVQISRKNTHPPILTSNKELNSLIAKVRSYQRQQLLGQNNQGVHTPLIIELTGTPNAGKDSLIWILRDYLSDVYGFKVRIIDEGIHSCHLSKDMDADRLYKTIALAVIQLYEAKYENPGNYDFIILNRGIFDRLSLLYTLKVMGQITEELEQIHVKYLLSYAHLEDRVFLFLINPEESIRRENLQRRNVVEQLFDLEDNENRASLKEQRMHRRDFLEQSNNSSRIVYALYKQDFSNQAYISDFSNGEDAGLLEKAQAMINASLPRKSVQLYLPELFGLCYVNNGSAKNRIAGRNERMKTIQSSPTHQMVFSW